MMAQADITLTDRASYGYFDTEKIRFSDTDMVGHVNNVAYAALLEAGRTSYTHTMLFPHMARTSVLVMARVEIDFWRELHWPASVDIGSRVTSIGRTSFVIGQGIFHDTRCITTGRTTLVVIDRRSRKPAALPQDYRAVLEALMT